MENKTTDRKPMDRKPMDRKPMDRKPRRDRDRVSALQHLLLSVIKKDVSDSELEKLTRYRTLLKKRSKMLRKTSLPYLS